MLCERIRETKNIVKWLLIKSSPLVVLENRRARKAHRMSSLERATLVKLCWE